MKRLKSKQTKALIRFSESFKPSYVYGGRKELEALGIKLAPGTSKEPWNWTYENPIVFIPQKNYTVQLNWNDEEDCCDVVFSNGVVFGYVDTLDFYKMDGIKPY